MTLHTLGTNSSALDKAYAPVFTAEKYGGAADGTTDSTAAIQAAIDAAAATRAFSAAGAAVQLQPGGYLTSSPLAMKAGVELRGAGRGSTTIKNTTTSLFSWTGTTLSNIAIRNASLLTTATAGHVFDLSSSGGIALSAITDCNMEAQGANASVFKQRGAGVYIEVAVERCTLTRSSAATVPGWDVVQANSLTNGNTWRRVRVHSNTATSTPFFRFECTSASTRNYDFTFEDVIGEQNGGGLLHMFGAMGVRIDHFNDYDQTTYVGDLFKFGVTTGLSTLDVEISRSGRRGGTLSGGAYDINAGSATTSSNRVRIVSCGPASGNMSAQLNDGCTLVATPTATYSEKNVWLDIARVSAFGGTAAMTVTQRYASANALDVMHEVAAGSTYRSIRCGRTIDSFPRFEISPDGTHFVGGGSSAATSGLRLGDAASLPTANSSERGNLRMIQGATGVADKLYMCLKSTADTYSWIQVAIG